MLGTARIPHQDGEVVFQGAGPYHPAKPNGSRVCPTVRCRLLKRTTAKKITIEQRSSAGPAPRVANRCPRTITPPAITRMLLAIPVAFQSPATGAARIARGAKAASARSQICMQDFQPRPSNSRQKRAAKMGIERLSTVSAERAGGMPNANRIRSFSQQPYAVKQREHAGPQQQAVARAEQGKGQRPQSHREANRRDGNIGQPERHLIVGNRPHHRAALEYKAWTSLPGRGGA